LPQAPAVCKNNEDAKNEYNKRINEKNKGYNIIKKNTSKNNINNYYKIVIINSFLEYLKSVGNKYSNYQESFTRKNILRK
jgi:hypothetical protein